jgi:hypothetical protein
MESVLRRSVEVELLEGVGLVSKLQGAFHNDFESRTEILELSRPDVRPVESRLVRRIWDVWG